MPIIPPDIMEKIMKTLAMYRPNTIQNALSDFDRYFESFFGDSVLAPAARMFNHLPAVDIKETENSYVLEMDLPGYDEKNIEVHIDGSSLTIAFKQEEMKNADENAGTFILRERRMSSFSRSFKLPENSNPESVNAAFKNGILTLQIQKRAEAQKRTIQINAA
jgi:HSP20 family protein